MLTTLWVAAEEASKGGMSGHGPNIITAKLANQRSVFPGLFSKGRAQRGAGRATEGEVVRWLTRTSTQKLLCTAALFKLLVHAREWSAGFCVGVEESLLTCHPVFGVMVRTHSGCASHPGRLTKKQLRVAVYKRSYNQRKGLLVAQ